MEDKRKAAREAKKKAKEDRKAKAKAKVEAPLPTQYKSVNDFCRPPQQQDFDLFAILDFEAIRERVDHGDKDLLSEALKEVEQVRPQDEEGEIEAKVFEGGGEENEWIYEATEFPVVLVDAKTKEIVAEFHRYCRPSVIDSKHVERYIKHKYGRFGQEEEWHKTSVPFSTALESLKEWMNENLTKYSTGSGKDEDQEKEKEKEKEKETDTKEKTSKARCAFVVCGDWDIKHLLPRNCALLGLEVPSFMKEWINIKTAYARHHQKRRPPAGMKNMLAELEIPLEGHHHYGLHDCRNIAKVLVRLLEDGCKLEITGREENMFKQTPAAVSSSE